MILAFISSILLLSAPDTLSGTPNEAVVNSDSIIALRIDLLPFESGVSPATSDSTERKVVIEMEYSAAIESGDIVHVSLGSSRGAGDMFTASLIQGDRFRTPQDCSVQVSGSRMIITAKVSRFLPGRVINYSISLERKGRISKPVIGIVNP